MDLEALLAAHAQQLDGQLAAQREDIMRAMALKSDKEEVAALEARQVLVIRWYDHNLVCKYQAQCVLLCT